LSTYKEAQWITPLGLFVCGQKPKSRGACIFNSDKPFPRAQKSNIISDWRKLGVLMNRHDNSTDGGVGTGTVVRTRPKTKKPSMYKVLMLNDDYTPMEFVVHVLENIFGMNQDEATNVMLHVHQRGVGVCGIFTYEVAETKVNRVMDSAQKNQHPLQCTLEKD
jgi:ATP-dependent Clp protease adaptor protein ClpS